MVQCLERRGDLRSQHTTLLMIKDSTTGEFSMARMVNYGAEGIFFETNVCLDPGEKIDIGIENSPYTAIPDVVDCYRVTIIWRRELELTLYKYGYGVRLSLT